MKTAALTVSHTMNSISKSSLYPVRHLALPAVKPASRSGTQPLQRWCRKMTVVALAAAALLTAASSPAAQLTWDAGNTNNGATINPASGNWDTTATVLNWNSGSGNKAWTQTSTTAGLNGAIFAGADAAAGTYKINLDAGQIAVTNMVVNNNGYLFYNNALYEQAGANLYISNGVSVTFSNLITGPNSTVDWYLGTGGAPATNNCLGGFSGFQLGIGSTNGSVVILGGSSTSGVFFDNGTVIQTNGTMNITTTWTLGRPGTFTTDMPTAGSPSFPGTYTLNGPNAAISQAATLIISRSGGSGTFNLINGTVNARVQLVNDNATSAHAGFFMSGGVLTNSSSIVLFNGGGGVNATAVYSQSGGTNYALGGIQLGTSGGPPGAGSVAAFTNSGGSLYIGSGGLTLNANAGAANYITFSGGTVGALQAWQSAAPITLDTLNGNVALKCADNNNSPFDITLAGALTGPGGFYKTGGGTLTLSGTNTYAGSTTVSNGTLLVNGVLGTNTVTVATNATLGGMGLIQGPVSCSAGGILKPGAAGNSLGTLTVSNSLAIAGNTTATFGLTNTPAASQIAISNNLVLTGNLTVSLNYYSALLPAGNYVLMTFAAKSGAGTVSLDKTYNNLSLVTTSTNVYVAVGVGGSTGPAPVTWVGDGSVNAWDTSTFNWTNATVGVVSYQDGDAVTFDDSGSSTPAIVLNTTVQPLSVTFSNSVNSYTVGGGGAIAGTGGLTKTGTGTATLSTTNTYSGATTISAGTLVIGGTGQLGNGTYAGNITNNGAFKYNSTAAQTLSGAISGSGSLTNSAGTLTLSGVNTYSGGTTVSAGALALAVGGSSGAIRNNLAINSGATVNLTAADALGYNPGVCVTNVNLVGGTLNIGVNGNEGYNTMFNLTGGTMTSSGGGAFNFNTNYGINSLASSTTSTNSAPVAIRGNGLTFTVAQGTTPSGVDLVNSGAISYGSGGSGSVTKAGSGTLVLSGTNTYTGTTIVSGGTLLVNGALGTNTVTVAANATLGGTGIIQGPVSCSAGGILMPGGAGNSLGTLTISNKLTIAGNATAAFGLTNTPAACQIAIATNLVLTGNLTISLNYYSLNLPAGDYVLLTFASKSGSGTVSLNGLYNNLTLTTTSTNVYVTVGAGGSTAPGSVTWVGDGSVNAWDTSTANWTNAVAGQVLYQDGDTVTFDDSGSSTPAIALNTTAQPLSVTFSNSVKNYTVGGSGAIAGAGGLTKAGTGTATLSTVNTYSGATTISAGTLVIGGTGQLGSGTYAGNITDNGAFNYNSTAAQTLSGVISGSGSLTNSAGTLTLSVANTYSGVTTISGGTLQLNNNQAASTNTIVDAAILSLNIGGSSLANAVSGAGTINVIETANVNTLFGGSLSNFTGVINVPTSAGGAAKVQITSASVNVSSNATFNIASGGTLSLINVTDAATNNVAGVGNSETLGALRVDNGSTVSGPVNLLGDTAIGEGGSGTISGVISGGYGITKVGGGGSTLTLSGVNTYTGDTTISAGMLVIGGAGKLGSGSYAGNLTNNAAFKYNSSAAQTLSGVISGSGTLTESAGTLTLSGVNTYTGPTMVSGGTLALGATSSINSTPVINLAAGATLDVSAISAFALSGNNSVSAAGTASAATLKGASGGTVNFGSQPITLAYDGTHPALTIGQGTLQLNGNAFTVNNAGPLASGTYILVSQSSGNITSAGTYSVTGTAIGSGSAGTVTVSGGNVVLTVQSIVTGTTQRGRPRLNPAGTTFVADNGEPLRGVITSGSAGLNTLAAVKKLGFNAVHMYAEKVDANYPNAGGQAPGYNVATMDAAVAATRTNGLYLIFNSYGVNNSTSTFYTAGNVAFWNFYGPRYANETHVIYEIQNEPVQWSPPYSDPNAVSPGCVDMEAACYQTIRSNAPATPVLLFTYASVFGTGSRGLAGIQQDIQLFNTEVFGNPNAVWTNEVVAFHGYAGVGSTLQTAAGLVAAGIPSMMTEYYETPWGTTGQAFDLQLTAGLEKLGISWLSFLDCTPNTIYLPLFTSVNLNYYNYTNVINWSGFSWPPDFGTYPPARGTYGNGGQPWTTPGFSGNTLGGTLHIEAENFDTGGEGVAYHELTGTNTGGQYRPNEGVDIETSTDTGGGYDVNSMATGEWLEYTASVSQPGLYNLTLRVAGGGGSVRCQSGALSGRATSGTWTVPNTGGAQTWTTITNSVFLQPGQQALRLSVLTGGFSLNWLELSPVTTGLVANGTYKILNRSSANALQGVVGSGVLTVGSYTGSTLQQWNLLHIGGNLYKITSVANSWSWDANGVGTPVGFNSGWSASGNKCFYLQPAAGGCYGFLPVQDGLGVEATTTNAAVTDQAPYAGVANQQWGILALSAPAFPTGLSALAIAPTQDYLAWNAVAGADSYNVKRATSSGGPYTVIATGVTATNYLDGSVSAGVNYYYVVSSVTGGMESLNSLEVRAASLRAWLKFDEASGTTAADASGNGWTGTLLNAAGTTNWVAGKMGNAVDLNGVSQYLTLPTGVVNGLTNFTISTWVNLDAVGANSQVFDFYSGTAYMQLTPKDGTGGTLSFGIWTAAGGGEGITGPSALPTGAWTQVAVTLNGTTGILYVNGVEVSRNSAMPLTPASMGATTQNNLGKSEFSNPYINGRMDDFRIYADALDSASVAALYAAPPSSIASMPVNLTAQAVYPPQVILAWNAVAGAGSYNVKRATTSGGPYTVIATGVTATNYLDGSVSAGVNYYYVVSSVTGGVESFNSAEARAGLASRTVAGDTDVVTIGTLRYAYHWTSGDQAVNGVTFTGTTSLTGGGSDVGLAGGSGNYGGFSSTATPFAALSAAYQNLLKGGDYGSSAPITVTFSNLTAGNAYAAQLWVNDARSTGATRTETVTWGTNVVTLDYNSTDAAGGVGQFAVVAFSPAGTTWSLTLTGNASSQINALQVRDISALVSGGSLPGPHFVVGQSSSSPPVIDSLTFIDGHASLLVDGPSKQVYTLLTSTNLTDWQTLLTTNPPTLPCTLADPYPATNSARYYRIKTQTGP